MLTAAGPAASQGMLREGEVGKRGIYKHIADDKIRAYCCWKEDFFFLYSVIRF